MVENAPTGGAWAFWIDVGGTFTDCLARRPDGAVVEHKLLSSGVTRGQVGPDSTNRCIVAARRRGDPAGFYRGWHLTLLIDPTSIAKVSSFDPETGRLALAEPLPAQLVPGMIYELSCPQPAPIIGIRWLMGLRLADPIGSVEVRLGTTRGTNALLERTGAATGLVTTAGFADLLRIGDQTRPRLFDLHIRQAHSLYSAVVELDERIDARGRVLRPLAGADVRRHLADLRRDGIDTLAVCLMNSYRNPVHERAVERLARDLGFGHISVSSELSPLQRIVPRGQTTVVDAYLTPVIRSYVDQVRAELPEASLKLMTSSGGLAEGSRFSAKDSILSGPAAGVVGCARVATAAGFEQAIGFDMGGTSTDVSRYDGDFERRYEMDLEDRDSGERIRIVAPMLSIETVAAGGGSVCGFDGVKPTVGPQSAGADPGPACYGRGGPLCLTDLNLHLGRLPTDALPLPLDVQAVTGRLDQRIAEIESATGRRYDRDALAAGYIAIANAHMAAAIKKVSIQRGYDPGAYVLVSFGGAGGQHACAIADELGINRILQHPYAGVLSAYGIGHADLTVFAARDVGRLLDADSLAVVATDFDEMAADLQRQLRTDGVADENMIQRKSLDLRYLGQESWVTINDPTDDDWCTAFTHAHRRLYGFTFPDRPIQVYAARLQMTGRTPRPAPQLQTLRQRQPTPASRMSAYFDGQWSQTAVYRRDCLQPGDRFDAPALVLEATSTIVVEPGWSAQVAEHGEIVLTRAGSRPESAPIAAVQSAGPTECDPVTLELFNNRFAAIAEQMGATLRNTALSTNVKERLDFSCAIYDAQGRLVAHAPHIPVHLGAMGQCVTCLIEDSRRDPQRLALCPGCVFITNDPYRGGSHLPDVTVITPVFDEAGQSVLFYAASRAHHAEIGGAVPGSMPSESRNLAEEGVVIRTMPLVEVSDDAAGTGVPTSGVHADAGPRFNEEELRRILSSGPHPSRAVDENIADVRAQTAANQCGLRLLDTLVLRHGFDVVVAYMGHIQQAACIKMRAALARLPDGAHTFEDYLDDGSPIAVTVTVAGDRATVDFNGTGAVLQGNLNATPAIVASAVLYCFRCLIDQDIPLNAGVLDPIRIVLPECLLNPALHEDPARCAAVAGGNVETSQRIVDVIFGALGLAAASQGTMNNLTFGDERLGYYETIGGGAGAGPDYCGADAVHTHMTNTRLTDPEVLEDRYPVRLRRFAIRRGSGGGGLHRGGDGIVREIELLEPMERSLLAQRRTRPPYGLAGGLPGRVGCNRVRRADGRLEGLPSLAHLRADPGDVLIIETPGGGGYGSQTGGATT
ncbi:MAG: hydantoinase [bacterium]|nr:hydantoinase [bacterium]